MKLTRCLDNRKIQNDLALISYLEMKKHVDRFILERNDYIHLMAAKEIGVDWWFECELVTWSHSQDRKVTLGA